MGTSATGLVASTRRRSTSRSSSLRRSAPEFRVVPVWVGETGGEFTVWFKSYCIGRLWLAKAAPGLRVRYTTPFPQLKWVLADPVVSDCEHRFGDRFELKVIISDIAAWRNS